MQPFLNTLKSDEAVFLGLQTLYRAKGTQTGGAFALVEHPLMPPGFETPLHLHHKEDESFYVVSGQVAFFVDGSWLLAGPGDFVFGPREVIHGFRVLGGSPAHMLIFCSPSGFEDFMLELSEPAGTPPSPPDVDRLMTTAAKFSIDILGPLPPHPETLLS